MASIEVHFDENTVAKLVDERLIVENAELKRLLMYAMEDLGAMADCGTCVENAKAGGCTKYHTKCSYQWRYAAEAEKLLNGRGEENG